MIRKSISLKIQKINEKIAVVLTDAFGTMTSTYICFFIAIFPAIYPKSEQIIQYISTTIIQLVALPLLMAGQEVKSRRLQKRANQQYNLIVEMHKEIKELRKTVKELSEKIN